MTKDQFIKQKIHEFNKNYCNIYSGDSGLGGNYPQEPVDEFACEPSDIRSFIREIVNQAYYTCEESMRQGVCPVGLCSGGFQCSHTS